MLQKKVRGVGSSSLQCQTELANDYITFETENTECIDLGAIHMYMNEASLLHNNKGLLKCIAKCPVFARPEF